jgi:molybdopterin synthase catalytic subunit
MKVRIVYFAAARELARCSSEEVPFPVALDLERFKHWLAAHKPRLAPYLPRMRLAINGEFAADTGHVTAGDEVTILPPVAGGSGASTPALLAEVREQPLSVDEVIAAVRQTSAGAIALFLGVVRDHHQGRAVSRLDYEAFGALANKEMARILTELAAVHPGARLAAVHRAGELAIGDLAVIVAASAPHRDEAFGLCRQAIDRIKGTVPIWKKEWAPDGTALWVNLERDERT